MTDSLVAPSDPLLHGSINREPREAVAQQSRQKWLYAQKRRFCAVALLFCVVAGAVVLTLLAVTPPALPAQSGAASTPGQLSWRCCEILRQPPEHDITDASDGHVVPLSVSSARAVFGGVSLQARLFDGGLPGPTFRVRRGRTLRIALHNNLGTAGAVASSSALPINSLRRPNETNLHFHGMHVSSAGHADNPFAVVGPGESRNIVLPIGDDHYPGTFFYHPHLHGSVSLQMGSGMAGAIIVEEDAQVAVPALSVPGMAYASGQGRLPLLALRDVVLVMQTLNVCRPPPPPAGTGANLLFASRASRSLLPLGLMGAWGVGQPPASEPLARCSTLVVNGQWQPKLPLDVGEWVRLRIVHAGTGAFLGLGLAAGADCTWELIAMDGVYRRQGESLPLGTPPRERLLLPPGSRADIAVRCQAPGRVAITSARAPHWQWLGTGSSIVSSTIMWLAVGESVKRRADARANASASAGASVGASRSVMPGGESGRRGNSAGPTFQLPALSPLLADLRAVEVPPSRRWNMSFTEDGAAMRAGYQYKRYGINGALYDGRAIARSVPVGAVEEWRISNELANNLPASSNHVFHLHVHHFQIVRIEPSEATGMDYAVGDWRDTISVPTPGAVTVRFRASNFSGPTLMHCHIIPHEDVGMMAVVDFVPRTLADMKSRHEASDADGAATLSTAVDANHVDKGGSGIVRTV